MTLVEVETLYQWHSWGNSEPAEIRCGCDAYAALTRLCEEAANRCGYNSRTRNDKGYYGYQYNNANIVYNPDYLAGEMSVYPVSVPVRNPDWGGGTDKWNCQK